MATTIESLNDFNSYFTRVMDKADHHGENVNEIILTLAGAVIWCCSRFDVRTRNNEIGNVLWMEVGEQRYVFSYNHLSGNIELRNRSIRGPVAIEFNNDTSPAIVKEFFDSL